MVGGEIFFHTSAVVGPSPVNIGDDVVVEVERVEAGMPFNLNAVQVQIIDRSIIPLEPWRIRHGTPPWEIRQQQGQRQRQRQDGRVLRLNVDQDEPDYLNGQRYYSSARSVQVPYLDDPIEAIENFGWQSASPSPQLGQFSDYPTFFSNPLHTGSRLGASSTMTSGQARSLGTGGNPSSGQRRSISARIDRNSARPISNAGSVDMQGHQEDKMSKNQKRKRNKRRNKMLRALQGNNA
ncbi:uncharacterized protein LOC110849896 isoform X2 [Folsomia candida]|nr:uncharacterized protein LOC110849896 isoform X2 [Folsomia candida]